ncbi:glycoside hydrolase family 3 protein [Streptomyces sp. NPDC020965]|uniref:glycoside hydrolase family 3 protein n=1 Tax=Streptomyces sp. NPDC020965 TaxID=3365105 RepID=UPI0037A96BD4
MSIRTSGNLTQDRLYADALVVLQPGFDGVTVPDWIRRSVADGLLSVALYGRNCTSPEQVAALTADLHKENPDILVAIDEEGGDVTRLEVVNGSSWPGNLALGAIDDPAVTRAVARELGHSLVACGVNFNWAPSADVNANPDNPVIGVRAFGADPQLCARHTAAWVEGLQSVGIAACAKHFPGHGDTAVDSHHGLPTIDVTEPVLRERDLVPFQAAIDQGVKAVMTAHIMATALDTEYPATLSHSVLTKLLRAPRVEGGLGFEGLIVTDAIEMGAISRTYGAARGTVLAIAAGADAICTGGETYDEAFVTELAGAVVRAVHDGDLPEERLADAADRVRTLGAWTAEQGRPDGRRAPDPEVGLAAARRALRVTTHARHTPVTGPVHVATFAPEANVAAGGATPWGAAAAVAELLPGSGHATYTEEPAAADGTSGLLARVLGEAGERRVVAVVRDVHRRPWMTDALRALVAARPDTVVIEMGVPQAEPVGSLHIATYGASPVCGRAAAEVIAGR